MTAMAKSEPVAYGAFPAQIASVKTAVAAPRIAIEAVSPRVDGGQFPAKAVIAEPVEVEADIFSDGHDQIAARLLWRRSENLAWQYVPMRPRGNDRWHGEFAPQQLGRHSFTIEAWIDVWGTFRSDLKKKRAAGTMASVDIDDGRRLLQTAAKRSGNAALARLSRELGQADNAAACDLLLMDTTAAAMAAVDEHRFLVRMASVFSIAVERKAALFASWYELFPRSQTRSPRIHGTFDDVIARLPAIHAMGFDVLYFPPIHPIGTTHRKGRNNSLQASPGDPGSPYAIGSTEGGHDAVHPQLGGIEAFRRLIEAAAAYHIELALDFAIQCAPDHPWLKTHPGWFAWRTDGSIRYAENPPKKYEDIVNVDFYAEAARPALWLALRDVVQRWIDEGVKIFRVDNPHTKPLPFWEWLIADIRSRHPEVIFLSEAFTRPTMMYRLAKLGFSQSYTYFIWRNSKQELIDYMTELTRPPVKHFFRPHFFVNTPDINPQFLQTSGRAGFLIRAALAATLSGLWGMYSGFELCEAEALPGREEYLHSEKYEIKPRDWNAPGNIVDEISRLNRIRRDNPALHTHLGIRFHNAWNDQVLYFEKATPDRSNVILAAISLDPHAPQHTLLEVPLWEFGLPDDGSLEVEELMSGAHFRWRGKIQHWYFDPAELPLAIWRVRAAESSLP
jgi:starch synthase (maltosyl-transferring)